MTMQEKPKWETNKKTGLPLIDDEAKEKMGRKGALAAIVLPIITTAVGFGIAYVAYH